MAVSCGSEEGPRPDVVLVVADTLRADRTTAVDPELETTTRLAELGKAGLTYRQAVAPSSWTLPSMAALFAGREVTTSRRRAFPDAPSLAERFSEAGYATVAVVANPLLTADNDFARGFDTFVVAPPPPPAEDGIDLESLRAWDATAVVRRALDRVQGVPADRPLFLYVHLMDPHEPYDPAHLRYAPGSPGWSADADGAPPAVAWTEALRPDQAAMLRLVRRAYDGQVVYADRALGGLLDALDRSRWRRRLVAVTADHGEGLFSHGANADADPGRAPLEEAYSDHGEQLFEEAVRVPLWLAGPGVPAGREEPRPVALKDLGGTLLELAGLAQPAPGERLPLSDTDPVPLTVFGTGSRGWFARTADRKLVLPFPERLGHEAVAPRLYAVEGPAYAPERQDLSTAEAERFGQLMEALARWRQQNPPPDADVPDDPETLERLRALGYIR